MSNENVDEYKDNEDQYGMGESLVPDLDAITNPKKANQSDVEVEVCNPMIRDEKFSKYVAYTIKGNDKEGSFNMVRRYKDFDRIRSLLVVRWPGCYIPPLPPKSVSNMESKFIEERRRQLQTFCKKISVLPYLHYSEEFQLFIRSPTNDLEKVFNSMAKLNYDDLIAKYSTTFSHLSGKDLNNETIMKISGFKIFLTKTKGYFENFRKITQNVAKAKRDYYQQFALFHSQVCIEYEKNIFSEYHNNSEEKNVFNGDPILFDCAEKVKEANTQPSLEYLYEWIKIESREIDAFIEALDERDKYESIKNKTFDKQKADTNDLQKVLSGKTSLKTIFSRKSKEEEVVAIEKSIAKSSKEIENFTLLHDMITLIIAYNEIIRFKSNKLEQYYNVVKLAATNELGNVRNLIEYWNEVMNNNNIKVEN